MTLYFHLTEILSIFAITFQIEIHHLPLCFIYNDNRMDEFTVSVRKLTDEELMREACESTFMGKSHASLLDLYKAEHSPVRTQMFWVTLKHIPLFISTHLLRHHVGSVPFQLTCRDDRKGGNPGMRSKIDEVINKLKEVRNYERIATRTMTLDDVCNELEWLKDNADRYTPVNLSLLVNAQSLIDMAKLRLCNQAHAETRIVFNCIKEEIAKIDPSLASMMVRKCVYRGGLCGEMRCCGFNNTQAFQSEMKDYASNFSCKQIGLMNAVKQD